MGLGYLNLGRRAPTLSGGEAQRIRLASQIGSGLTGVLYVLDEPTIGLHQRDNRQLLAALARLRDLGNSLLVVEHDRQTLNEADHIQYCATQCGNYLSADRKEITMKQQEKQKKRYSKPKLVSYGNADDLILGGTSSGDESSGPQTSLYKD